MAEIDFENRPQLKCTNLLKSLYQEDSGSAFDQTNFSTPTISLDSSYTVSKRLSQVYRLQNPKFLVQRLDQVLIQTLLSLA